MINHSLVRFDQVSIHQIGCKAENEGISISDNPLLIDNDSLKTALEHYFFKQFKEPDFYKFTFSNEDHTMNPIFQYAKTIFNQPDLVHNQSIFIAKHLYEKSAHPNIKSGDLMLVYLEDLVIDEQYVNTIGIYKSEEKDAFLKTEHLQKQINLNVEQGINVNKIDKACLILNDEESDGYKVCVLDKSNPQKEVHYWVNDFLNIIPKNDDYHQTTHYINLTKSFIKDRLVPEFEIEKFEEAAILNRTKEYFKRVERFEEDNYNDRIFFSNKDIIDEFSNYKEEYTTNEQFDLEEEFFISPQAYKKNARYLRSVIKLDKNFHIYVHGNHDLIEKGKDDKGTYYKVYYDQES